MQHRSPTCPCPTRAASCARSSTPPSPPPTRCGACPRRCRRSPPAGWWWSAPARRRPAWRKPSRRPGDRARGWSSPATATAARPGASRSSRRRIRCPTRAGWRRRPGCCELVDGLGEDDFVLALISGGGSALLVQPAGAITLAEKQAVNDALLASGAPIGEMNIVRKHLSRVKGGQLAAAAWPARVLALMISDIPGDDPALIASGPTVGDASTPADARAILARWAIPVPASVEAVLAAPTGVLAPGRAAPRPDREPGDRRPVPVARGRRRGWPRRRGAPCGCSATRSRARRARWPRTRRGWRRQGPGWPPTVRWCCFRAASAR